MSSRVLVTGASGFIGSRLVQRLSQTPDDPFEVLALVRNPRALSESKSDRLKACVGDLTDPNSLAFIRDEGEYKAIDVVFHLAAVTPESRSSRSLLRKVNLDGTKNVFEAIHDRAKHFVYVSGLAVFESGQSSDSVVNEESPKSRQLEYIKIRLEAEEYLRQHCESTGIDFTVVYLPDIVYGNAGGFRRIFLEQINNGRFKIPGSGEYYSNFIHLDDAVNILIAMSSKRREKANQAFIACDFNPTPFREFVHFVAEQLGAKRPGSVPLFLAKVAVGSDLIKMLTKNTKAANKKIASIYDFQYPTYRDGIPHVVSQFRSTL